MSTQPKDEPGGVPPGDNPNPETPEVTETPLSHPGDIAPEDRQPLYPTPPVPEPYRATQAVREAAREQGARRTGDIARPQREGAFYAMGAGSTPDPEYVEDVHAHVEHTRYQQSAGSAERPRDSDAMRENERDPAGYPDRLQAEIASASDESMAGRPEDAGQGDDKGKGKGDKPESGTGGGQEGGGEGGGEGTDANGLPELHESGPNANESDAPSGLGKKDKRKGW
jgi:hypothetical protein